jgi:hypothetical protein
MVVKCPGHYILQPLNSLKIMAIQKGQGVKGGKALGARTQWLMPVILTAWEAEIEESQFEDSS